VTSFRGIPSTEGLTKRYKLHYQPRKIEVDGVEVQGQYGCLNFQAKRGSQLAKLTVSIKNKWFRAWSQAWFYCKVPLPRSSSLRQCKGIYALHSYMTGLDFATELSFECLDDDASDIAFVRATRTIDDQDAVEEYMACELFLLPASFGLGEIAEGETPVSKLVVPMPTFPIVRLPEEMNDGFVARVELAAVNVVGLYARREHKVCAKAVLNDGQVNRVFEQLGVPYGPRLEHGSEACEEGS
jgi:hypothetical protein